MLVQGEAPKAELLQKFVEHGNGLLLGTSSFWEGVDVRGEALSLVVIDKLPFASPGDPVLQARLDAIKARGVKRFYLAAAWGHISESPLLVEAPIGRDPKNRKRMAIVEDGREATTRFEVRERWLRADLLHVALKTGRTHQIRVHLEHLGHPVIGDATYGLGWERGLGGPTRRWVDELSRRVNRQFLHAAELRFHHPATGEEMHFESPLPADLAAVADWARSE